MVAKAARVYIDTSVFLNVVKRERPFWAESLKVLQACEQGFLQLQASTVLQMELLGWRGDWPSGTTHEEAQERLNGFLASQTTAIELDAFVIRDAARLALKHHLRGADATHLALALRLDADYLFTRDDALLAVGKVEGLQVQAPAVVWGQQSAEDILVDLQYEEETRELARAAQAALAAQEAGKARATARAQATASAPIEATPQHSNGQTARQGPPAG